MEMWHLMLQDLDKPMIKMMNLLGYDAGTIGNHDFDNGIEQLAQLLANADFPLINCNYEFTRTPLENKILL